MSASPPSRPPRHPDRPHLRGAGVVLAAFATLLLAVGLMVAVDAPAPRTASAAPAAPDVETGPTRTRKPNIVMVLTDDMRHDELQYMPNVRRWIQRRGTDFRNAFAPTPLCCPARASLLGGRYMHNHKVFTVSPPYGYRAFDDSRTLATALKAQGYRTGFFGKYLNGYGPDRPKAGHGRAHSYTYVPRGWDDWRASVDKTPYPKSDPRDGGTYHYRDTTLNVNGRLVGNQGKYVTDVQGRHTRQMLGKLSGRRPFFLMLNPIAPHAGTPREKDDPGKVRARRGRWMPLASPARPNWVKGRFDRAIRSAPGVPANGGPTEADVRDKVRFTRARPELSRVERRRVRELARQRAESLFVLDRKVGEMMRQLRRSGELRNTIVVFTSDNGFQLGEHRHRMGKLTGYEPSYRVPLLMAGPGIPRGDRYSPASLVDLSATILKWAGARMRHDGTPLQDTLRRDRGWRYAQMYEARLHGVNKHARTPGFHDKRTGIGVRTARYMFIRYRGGQKELFDLKRDPLELRSVARSPRYAKVRRQLSRVWWRMLDCKGRGCQVLLQKSLQTGPRQTAQLRRGMAQATRRYYG